MTRSARWFVAVVVTAGAVAGCSSAVSGTAEPSAGSTPTASIPGALADLLVDPSQFPSPYQAVVLPPSAAAQAAQDLGGTADGASVDPPGCKPTARVASADSVALVVGTDNASRSTISVELTRVRDTLADQTSLWEQCPEVTATSNDVVTTVSTTLVPPPPIDADDSAAVRRTVTSTSVTQSMLSLVAQYDDVRVTATFMSFSGAQPDSAVLDELFTSAAGKVKAAR